MGGGSNVEGEFLLGFAAFSNCLHSCFEVLVKLDSGPDRELDSGLDHELDSGLDHELDSGL